MTLPFTALKDDWMKDSAFRAEYDALAPEFALSRSLTEARANAGLTQAVGRRIAVTLVPAAPPHPASGRNSATTRS